MRFLSDVDGDEVSLVRRAANKRRFLMLKGDSDLDAELSDILDMPWEREGALLDEIRKSGVNDETVEKAMLAGIRLLKGVETELSPELVEKLGNELYGVENPAINTGSGTGNGGELVGSAGSDDTHFGSGDSGIELSGSGRDGELTGSGSGDKVAADSHPDDCDCEDCQMNKADFSEGQRRDLASRGQAQSDGSYPIRNKDDLHNAIQAFGRAKNPGKTKAWIIRRAKALGATSMLPDSWGVSKSDNDADNGDVMSDVSHDEGGAVDFRVPVKKEDGTWDYSGVPDEAREFFETMVEKSDRAEKELADAHEKLEKAAEDRRHSEAVQKAASFSHVAAPDDLAPILKEASEKLDPETVTKLEEILGTVEARVEKGDLFTELGSRSIEDAKADTSAYAEAVKKADEMVEKSDKPLTQDMALAKVWESHPELYAQYLSENPGLVNA